ncbi:MAG TPA: ATP-binding protein [Gemmataceae bacterium]|nr:ATP-binding protein [Gemmataceae bacterium]
MVRSPSEVSPREASQNVAPAADWCSRTLHASGEIVPAIEDIIASLDAVGFSSKEAFGVRLALEEALVNAIKHGHKGDPSKEVHLRYHLTTECLVAEIEDQGPGFKPQEVPDPFAPENLERPCGRGLLLMRNYMTWVRFNSVGNCVTMCRLRRGA